MNEIGFLLPQMPGKRGSFEQGQSAAGRERINWNADRRELLSHQAAAGGQRDDARLKFIARQMGQKQRELSRTVGRIKRCQNVNNPARGSASF